jgi:hypothetical protein
MGAEEELRWAWGTGASLTNFIWAVQVRSQMLWNFVTIATFVAVLGSTLFMLMTDREGFLTDREKVSRNKRRSAWAAILFRPWHRLITAKAEFRRRRDQPRKRWH